MTARARERLDGMWVPLIVLVGTVLRFWNLGQRGFWFDEALAVLRAAQPDLTSVFRTPPSYELPVYHSILHFWLAFGSGEAVARSFSALLSSVNLALAWLILKRILPRGEALATLALFALSPWQVAYAQEARPYALRQSLEFGALLVLVAASRRTALAWAGWSLLLGLDGLVHQLGLLWIPAHLVYLEMSGKMGKGERGKAAGWALAAALPALVMAWANRAAISRLNSSNPVVAPLLDFVVGAGQLFGAGPYVPRPLYSPVMVLLGVFTAAGIGYELLAVRKFRSRGCLAAYTALGLLPLLMLLAGNWCGLVYNAKLRYAMNAHLFVLAAWVHGVWLIRRREACLAVLGLFLAVEAASLGMYFRGGFPTLDMAPYKKPLREAAGLVRERLKPGDVVVGHDYLAYLPLRIYLAGAAPVRYVLTVPEVSEEEIKWMGRPSPLKDLIREYTRVWLVICPGHFGDSTFPPDDFIAPLRAYGVLVEEKTLPGIRIQLWRSRVKSDGSRMIPAG